MPTVIDELIVKIGLDPTKFNEGEKKAIAQLAGVKVELKKSGDEAEAQSQRAQSNLTKATRANAAARQIQKVQSDIARKHAADETKAKTAATKTAASEDRKRRDEAKKASDERTIQLKDTARLFKDARNQALAFLAVAVGGKGLEAFVKDSVASNAALGRSAHNIGIAVPELSAFQNAIVRNGGSAEEVTGSFQGLTDEMEELKVTGQSAILPFMQMIPGVSRMSSAADIIKSFVAWADKHRNDAPLVNLVGKGLGLDQGTINESLKGQAQVLKDIADAQASALGPEQSRRAAELQSSWAKFGQTLGRVGGNMLYSVEPHLKGSLDWLTGLIGGSQKATAAVLTLLGGLTGIAAVAKSIAGIKFLGRLLGLGGSTGATAGAEAAGAAGSTAGGTVAAIAAPAAVAAGMLVLKGDTGPGTAADFDSPTPLERIFPSLRKYRSRADSSDPRGIRNNNPGNLNFVGQEGATLEDGPNARFAKFPTMTAGIAALVKQLKRYAAKGINTVRAIISKWAPASENNTPGYINNVAKDLGVDPDQKLNIDDVQTERGLVRAISNVEVGRKRLSPGQIDAGLELAARLPKFAPLPGLMPVPTLDPAMASIGAGAIAEHSYDNKSNSTSTTDVKIGQVTVNTPATDAKGIARDMGSAIRSDFTTQANTGMF